MATAIGRRLRGVRSLASGIKTFEIDQNRTSCRVPRCSTVISKRAHRFVPVARRVLEIAMIAVRHRLRLQVAPGAPSAQVSSFLPLRPLLCFASAVAPFRLTITAPPAPVGVGWG
jgi:hypothetical protein